jgi:hypothetical protein
MEKAKVGFAVIRSGACFILGIVILLDAVFGFGDRNAEPIVELVIGAALIGLLPVPAITAKWGDDARKTEKVVREEVVVRD